MSHKTLSVLLWCWHDRQTNTTQVRIVDVATGEEVRLKEGTFLLRISSNKSSSVERCLIRHLASGRQAYVQGGSQLRKFVKTCLLDSTESTTDDADKAED